MLTADEVGPALRRVLDEFHWIDIHSLDVDANWHRNIEDGTVREEMRGGDFISIVDKLTEELNKTHKCQLPPSVQEALNSGDGTYRP